MTIELGLCLFFLVISLPISRSIALHYLILAAVNIALLGVTSVDSSLLAMIFTCIAVADALIFMFGGRQILLLNAFACANLAIESMLNMDILLSAITLINVIVNAVIAADLVKGYLHWTHGK